MKKGLTQICLGAETPIRDALALCRDLGYDGLEIVLGDGFGPDDRAAIGRMREASGVELTSIAALGDLSADDPEVVAAGKARIRNALETAAALGIDTVLVTGGRTSAQVPYDVAYDRTLLALQDLRADAERCRVHIGLENVWNKLLLSPLEFRDFLDRIGSPYVGAYFDTGNVVLYGYPEQWIRILGTRIRKVHFKDFKIDHRSGRYAWTQLREGDVDWPAVMGALRAIGYDGYVISEVCGDREVYEQSSRAMDEILAL